MPLLSFALFVSSLWNRLADRNPIPANPVRRFLAASSLLARLLAHSFVC
jgi:hypothetical protein